MTDPKKIVLLGATGSIGESTLQVIRKHSDRLQLIGVSAHSNSRKLANISNEFKVPHAYLPETASEVTDWPSHCSLDRSTNGLTDIAALELSLIHISEPTRPY